MNSFLEFTIKTEIPKNYDDEHCEQVMKKLVQVLFDNKYEVLESVIGFVSE